MRGTSIEDLPPSDVVFKPPDIAQCVCQGLQSSKGIIPVRCPIAICVYFSGKAPDFTPALAMRTTAFRKAVWEILLTIPYGRTMTYGQIAERIAAQTGVQRMSAQAVGGAVGHNPFALIVPCHRVIGAGGNMTGYAAGMDKKIALLRMEGADMSTFRLPE